MAGGNKYFGPQSGVSNAIGSFEIGVSPIGTIDPFNWGETVISQYANSPIILSLISNFYDAESQVLNFDNWYDNVWNILTATGYGLDVWGRILGIGRALAVNTDSNFGFKEANDLTIVGFDQEAFYAGPATTDNYLLTDSAYRLLLLAKAAANICDGSIPQINKLLLALFPGRGNSFVLEGNGVDEDYFGFKESGDASCVGFGQEPFYDGETFSHMNIRYVFQFPMTPVEIAIITQTNVLPTPSGVQATYVINP